MAAPPAPAPLARAEAVTVTSSPSPQAAAAPAAVAAAPSRAAPPVAPAAPAVDADADAAALAWADEHGEELGAGSPRAAPLGAVVNKPLLSLEEAVARVPEGVRLQLEERLRGRFREVRRLD